VDESGREGRNSEYNEDSEDESDRGYVSENMDTD
jgi:hypothetical protein